MKEHSLELSLLLAASRLELDSQAESLLCDFAAEIDWTILVETAYAQGVTGLLCSSLLKMPETLVPEAIRSGCHGHLQQRESTNHALADQLCLILAALEAAGIKAIPFKGPTLAMTAYQNISLRTFLDLDFLIHEQQIQPCLDKLRELGYVHEWRLSPKQWQVFLRYAGQDILFGKGAPIEPHWAFAPRTLSLDIDYAGLWQRTIQKSFNGHSILSLAPEDELLVLCIHGCKEKWSQLKWVVDVAEFVRHHPALYWESLISRAEAQGLARMLALGLGLARYLLNAPIPRPVIQWLEKDRYALRWSENLAARFFDEREETSRSIYALSWFHWAMRERIGDRWRYLFHTLTQPRVQHFVDIAFPDSLYFLYTPYKLIHDYLLLPIWLWVKACHRGTKAQKATEAADVNASR
ncbi:MAG: nucleotidyltransferase family protein [Methylomicrobium sp.]|nr:nucleotidyltransferase family protein [Methylomicrobium sp.]